jgi:hypothetical protein
MTSRTDAGIAELEARNVGEALAELVAFREGTKRDLAQMEPARSANLCATLGTSVR